MVLQLELTVAEKLKQMWTASWESICWRQDQYATGGIVESDERVDGGRKLYWPWCWPRNVLVEPMLNEGYFDRVRRFLEFWSACQSDNGAWYHCYDIRTGRQNPNAHPETDNVGYMLWHLWAYVQATDDLQWLRNHNRMVYDAADYLLTLFNPELNLVWGTEEVTVVDEATGREFDCPTGYTTPINAVCEKGLCCAAELAGKLGNAQKAKVYANHAAKIARALDERLFDEKARTYKLAILDNGMDFYGSFWFILMPGYINLRWDDRMAATFDYIWSRNYGHDPKIPEGLWFCDFRPILNKKESCFYNYSGLGPSIGVSPVIAHLSLLAGNTTRAIEQINLFTSVTSENHLIPEHINTIHPGKLGNYSLYPNGDFRVDSGNLMHLSFFLRLMIYLHEKVHSDLNK